jgi:hypothetical protein
MGLFGLVCIGWGIKLIFFPIKTVDKLIETAYQVQDKTLNADNAIYNYEWFKQTFEDIQALGNQYRGMEKNIEEYKQTMKEPWGFEEKQEYARLLSVKQGLFNRLEQVAADYNARAKMANRKIFADKILPDFIEALKMVRS